MKEWQLWSFEEPASRKRQATEDVCEEPSVQATLGLVKCWRQKVHKRKRSDLLSRTLWKTSSSLREARRAGSSGWVWQTVAVRCTSTRWHTLKCPTQRLDASGPQSRHHIAECGQVSWRVEPQLHGQANGCHKSRNFSSNRTGKSKINETWCSRLHTGTQKTLMRKISKSKVFGLVQSIKATSVSYFLTNKQRWVRSDSNRGNWAFYAQLLYYLCNFFPL